MTARLLAFAALVACVPTAGPASPVAPAPAPPPAEVSRDVAYRLAPVFDGADLVALAVELRLHADASGTTRLHLPEQWASERELFRYVTDLDVEGARSIERPSPALCVIESAPDQPLVVHYRVVSAYDRDPTSDDGQPFAPIVRPTWFYAFGEAVFAAPEGRDQAHASFAWTGDLAFASDLEHLPAHAGIEQIRDSLVMGGQGLRVHARADGKGEIRVAMLGRYGFTDAAFVDMAERVIAAERGFWNEHGEDFTITLAPLVAIPGSRSLGGTGRSDGFTILMSDDAPLPPLRHLLAHEYFHTWNADRLGGQQDGAAEMRGKWFAEGFTEYYTWRLLLRSGLYELGDFVDDWNAALLEYASSPVRNEPNRRIEADYWNDPAVGRLPYRRGPLLAAMFEQRLRAATDGARGLDDVMLAMREAVREAGARRITPDAASLFAPTYRALGGPDPSDDLARYVDRGETIALTADVFGACLRVVDERVPTFDRGFDAAATAAAGNVVTGVRTGSAAHRAGLRDGMTILARTGGVTGDARVDYVLRVQDGKRERTIRYRPRGAGEIALQRIEIVDAPTPADRAACARRVAGGG